VSAVAAGEDWTRAAGPHGRGQQRDKLGPQEHGHGAATFQLAQRRGAPNEVDVLDLERQCRPEASAGAEQECEERPVSRTGDRRVRGQSHRERCNVGRGQPLRRRRLDLRHAQHGKCPTAAVGLPSVEPRLA
jgi:hypothetical protein